MLRNRLLLAASVFALVSSVLSPAAMSAPEAPTSSSVIKPWGIHYLEKMDNGIWRGTQPNQKDLETLKANGVKTIIDIRMLGPDIWRERRAAQKMGFKYYNFPMSVLHVADHKVQAIMKILRDPEAQPVFLHCRFGGDRSAAMLAIYRVMEDKWTYDKAYAEMREHHFIPVQYVLKRAVRRYTPDQQSIAEAGNATK